MVSFVLYMSSKYAYIVFTLWNNGVLNTLASVFASLCGFLKHWYIKNNYVFVIVSKVLEVPCRRFLQTGRFLLDCARYPFVSPLWEYHSCLFTISHILFLFCRAMLVNFWLFLSKILFFLIKHLYHMFFFLFSFWFCFFISLLIELKYILDLYFLGNH